MVLWRLTRPSRTNNKKRCPFHYRGLESKIRKSRDTWSNRQIWPWSTKWSRTKANRVFPRDHTSHSKHPLSTTQEMTPHMDITRCQHQSQIDYILCSRHFWDWIQVLHFGLLLTMMAAPFLLRDFCPQSAKIRSRADCGSDHELFIAKFRLELKKAGKATRPFRCDLTQIPYDYTVE